jgi:hypothetical protein
VWMSEWRAISSRIEGLVGAGAFFFRTNVSDEYWASGILIDNGEGAVLALRRLFETYRDQLPEEPKQCLERFLNDCTERFEDADRDNPFGRATGFAGVTGVLTSLASFRSEFEYLIADNTAVARSLVVRAFIHLQRLIVADPDFKRRWLAAFSEGEVACEGLGACHLLAHGIWAFKTSAAGERTDLVLGEELAVSDEIRRASQGLVLTEWKCVRSESELQRRCREAMEQARRYREGILAGFEVGSPRYLVMVSPDYMSMPRPQAEGEVMYEFRNVAVDPSSPSRFAGLPPPSDPA